MLQPIFKDRAFTAIAQPPVKLQVTSLIWSDAGGPQEARLMATGSPEQLYTLTGMMRYPIDIYVDFGVWVWGGYISELVIGSGAYTYGVQLDTMANKVAVAYSYIEPGTNDAGNRKTTAFVSDATSIAEFGTKETLISQSGMSDATAEQARDTALATHKYPQGTLTWGQADNQAEVICKGWFSTLGWRLASWASVTGPNFQTENADQSIGAASGNQRGLQQFTVGTQAINILTAAVYLRKSGTPTDDLTLQVFALDGSGNPTGSALTSGTIAGGGITTGNAWVSVTLTEYELAASTQYGLVVSRSGAVDASNYYIWRVDTGLGYSGGAFKLYDGANWAARSPNADGTFLFTVNNKVLVGTQLRDLTTQYGQFIASQIWQVSASSTPALPSYRDGDTDTLSEIAALMDVGTTNDRNIIAVMDADRRVIWSEEPAASTVAYNIYRDGRITDSNGTRITQYRPPYGAWARLADVPATADTSLLIDASVQYITGAEWTPDGGATLTLRGDVGANMASGTGSINLGELRPYVQGMVGTWVYPRSTDGTITRLTSTSWDGDARSTTAKTLIDLSAVFGVPPGVKAVLVRFYGRDSGSSGATSYYAGLSPNSTDASLALAIRTAGVTNDAPVENTGPIPCNADGDIYFQCAASGAGTLDVWIEVWGWMI